MKKYFQTGVILLTGSLIIGIIMYASYRNYMDIQANVIRIEQQQLLTLAETVSNSIERFFVNHQRDLEVISKNKVFIQDYEAFKQGQSSTDSWRLLEDYYQINQQQVNTIGLVDRDGISIYAFPIAVDSTAMKNDLDTLESDYKKNVGSIYKQNGELYIHIIRPVDEDSELPIYLYMRIRLLDVYKELVAPIKAGDKGYASVKDANGVLIMHPNTSDLGEEVLEARRSQYPDFDWSELEELVKLQKMGQSGVGVYHSLWFKETVKTRVKKFSAYTPAEVGDTFWIVNISKDYLEVVSFLRERTYSIIIINFTLLALFITSVLIYYRMSRDRKALQIQMALSEKVVNLNEALEADIAVRKDLESELIESKEWYEQIFNSSSDHILIVALDHSGRPNQLLDANEKALHSLGYTREEITRLKLSDISTMNNSLIQSVNRAEGLTIEHLEFEDVYLSKEGSFIPVEVEVRSFINPKGLQLVLVSKDITDKKAQLAALKRSEERFRAIVQQVADRVVDVGGVNDEGIEISEDKALFAVELENINLKLERLFQDEVEENKRKEALMVYQARLAAMGEMIGSIAHQWRQPLSVINMVFSNVLDAFRHGELDDALINEQHKRMMRLTKHMSDTIDDFRYFFDPNAEASEFLLSKMIQRALSLLDDTIKQVGVEVIFQIEEDHLIQGYENQLSQVFLSVVQNSLEALQEHVGLERKLWIHLNRQYDMLSVNVEDSAGGVSEAVLNRLYEPHFSTKKSKQGTGLGLYIAKVIIEKNFSGIIESKNGDYGLLTRIAIPLVR